MQIIKKRHKPLCMTSKGILTYHFGNLYLYNIHTNTTMKICSIPISPIIKLIGRFRLLERIFRIEPRMATTLSEDNVVFSYQGKMYNINICSGRIVKEIKFERKMNNPLSIVRISGIKGFDDCIVYGEYIGNNLKGPVAIYARSLNVCNWRKVFEFGANTIRHIHNIIPDSFRDCVYILTGDSDDESGIWIAKNNFSDVNPLLMGLQKYRSCCAFSIPEGLIYATDTPTEQNYICLLKQTHGGWESKILVEISGSCIYGTKFKDKYVFSTTVEPDSNLRGIRYKLSYRLGLGIKSWYSNIYMGDTKNGFRIVESIKKDLFPMWACQFGNIFFCQDCEESVYAYPIAVLRSDGNLVVIEVNNDNIVKS